MKEIGERFQEARENIGISIEEAATDLKVENSMLQNLESGNIKAFENVVSLKYLIRDYSRYLGMNAEEVLDEYNEYLFDRTSKISLEDIKAAKKRLAKQSEMGKEKHVKSPYTNFKNRRKMSNLWIVFTILILIVTIFITVVYFVQNRPVKEDNTISYIR